MDEFKLRLRELFNININSLDFLTETVEKVYECMAVLKWSYVYGYNIDDEVKREFF